MVERGEGGSVVLTSSTAGIRAYANTAHYTAAKHGVIGLMKVLAQELGQHRIRVNAVCPTTVRTPLVINDATFELFAPDLENPTEDDVREPFEGLNILPGVAWIEPGDVSDAVAVPVLGRRQVHHRHRAADRRRQHRQVSDARRGACALQGEDRAGAHAGSAVDLGEADAAGLGHLAVAGLAAQLQHDLVHLAQP